MYLNIKTEYNIGESIIKLSELKNKLSAINATSFAVCDENTQSFMKVAKEFQGSGITPVYGIGVAVEQQMFHLYAKNNDGLMELNRLVTRKNHGKSIDIFKFSTNLAIVIAKGKIVDEMLNTGASTMLDQLREKYGEDLYLGIYSYLNDKNNYRLLNMAEKFNLKQVLIDPIKYLEETDLEAYLTLQAVKYNHEYFHFPKFKAKAQRYMLNTEYAQILEDVLINSMILLEECNADPLSFTYEHPKYPFLDGKSAAEKMDEMIKLGLNWRYPNGVNPEIETRIQYELKVIKEMDFVDYFLIVQDIVIYAKKNDILVGPGRGSAAGSLVAYVLGITEIDPVKHDLYFERFLNPMRKTMPDIDIDFEASHREDIIQYITNHFGDEKVCKIGTIKRYLAKSAFREVAKIWRLDPKLTDLIAKRLDSNKSIMENIKVDSKLYQMINTDMDLMNVIKIALVFEKLPNAVSVHAAGVIVGNGDIGNLVAKTSENVSLLEASELEQIGLLKIDILALDNLTIIKSIVKRVNKTNESFNLNAIPLSDEKTYELLSAGNTQGIFQMESAGMRSVLTKIQPKSFAELALVLAFYRPGAKDQLEVYLNNSAITTFSKAADVLNETRGVIIYQEQVLKLANVLANYSLAEADIMRRAIAKKDETLLENNLKEFVARSIENGVDEGNARHIAEQISKFAGYGFNKAHAYAYGLITYQMSYLKANYPKEYYEIMFEKNYKGPQSQTFFNELNNQKIRVFAPDLRYSQADALFVKNQIMMGFNQIRLIDNKLAQKLPLIRKKIKNINDIEQISKFLDHLEVNQEQVKSLIYAGVFDYLGYNQPTLIKNFIEVQSGENNIAKLFGEPLFSKEEVDYSIELKVKNEKSALGINIKYNVLNEVRRAYQNKINHRIYSIQEIMSQKFINQEPKQFIVLFKIEKIHEIKTKNNELMAFLKVESDGEYDLTCFPNTYAQLKNKIHSNQERYVIAQINLNNERIYLQKM